MKVSSEHLWGWRFPRLSTPFHDEQPFSLIEISQTVWNCGFSLFHCGHLKGSLAFLVPLRHCLSPQVQGICFSELCEVSVKPLLYYFHPLTVLTSAFWLLLHCLSYRETCPLSRQQFFQPIFLSNFATLGQKKSMRGKKKKASQQYIVYCETVVKWIKTNDYSPPHGTDKAVSGPLCPLCVLQQERDRSKLTGVQCITSSEEPFFSQEKGKRG